MRWEAWGLTYGYHTQSGYMGRLASGRWVLFPTQEEYLEQLEEVEE